MRLTGQDEFSSTFPPPNGQKACPPRTGPANAWPPEVDMILSAMEAAANRTGNRRRRQRKSCRTCARLRLFAHDPLSDATSLFTRDIHRAGLGFITQEYLPLGYAGLVEFTLEDGRTLSAHCSVARCREAVNGWYEGALTFTQEQPIEA